MIARKSALILENFVIVDSHISLIVANEKLNTGVVEILNSYPVEIDFSIEEDSNDELFRIVTTIEINNKEERNPGYSILVTGMSFFKFENHTPLPDNQRKQMLQVSGLSICIANIRSYIANQTSYYPWGSFSFHAIDIQHLLEEKQKTVS